MNSVLLVDKYNSLFIEICTELKFHVAKSSSIGYVLTDGSFLMSNSLCDKVTKSVVCLTSRVESFCKFRMWHLVRVTFLVFIVANTGDQTTTLVNLQTARIEHSLRSIKDVVMTTELQTISACVLFGTSVENCHAVNYNKPRLLCEIISMHGSVLEMQNDTNYVFVALNNTHELLDTGIRRMCAQGPIQWKEQATWHYVDLENVVYSNEAPERRHICQVTVGDNEIPGVSSKGGFCSFV